MSSPAIVLDLPYREEGQLFTQMKGSCIYVRCYTYQNYKLCFVKVLVSR